MNRNSNTPSYYNRQAALDYATIWWNKRNPNYLDFSDLGGDCTNFISQCLYEGIGKMNYTPLYGWYYTSSYDRTPSWSGVPYLYNFLIKNTGSGPHGIDIPIDSLLVGDVIQLGNNSHIFYHSLLVVEVGSPPSIDSIYVTTHTFDAIHRPLSSYSFSTIRYIHIF